MNTRLQTLAALLCLPLTLTAQPSKQVISITEPRLNATVAAAAERDGTATQMARVLESVKIQIETNLQATRRYELFAADPAAQAAINEAVGFNQSGLVDTSLNQAIEPFKAKGVEFVLLTQILDFQNLEEKSRVVGRTVTTRRIRLSAVSKIVSVERRTVVESVDHTAEVGDLAQELDRVEASGGSELDRLFLEAARDLGDKVANGFNERISPARVLAVQGQFIMINRGEGTGIERGQKYEVMALGEEMFNPDTGESLGFAEFPVGMAEVVRVNPKFSQARLVENFGVEKGAVVRLMIEEENE